MPSRKIACCIVVALLAVDACGADKDLEQQLNDKYKGRAFILQHFYRGGNLHYNAQGELIGKSQQVPWTLSRILINSVKLKSGVLRIDGDREGDLFQNRNIVSIKLGRSMRIQADLPASATEAEADVLFGKIFFLDKVQLMNALPLYWREVFQRPDNPDTASPKEHKTADGTVTVELASEKKAGGTNPGATVEEGPTYKVGAGVTAPQAVRAPDPEYPEWTRQARVQGTCVLVLVVDRNGAPKDIRIARALGMGLDENAVAAVSRWHFQPATKNGQAVAVLINVEVNFRLY